MHNILAGLLEQLNKPCGIHPSADLNTWVIELTHRHLDTHTNSPDVKNVHHAKNVVWGEGQEMAVMVNPSLKS